MENKKDDLTWSENRKISLVVLPSQLKSWRVDSRLFKFYNICTLLHRIEKNAFSSKRTSGRLAESESGAQREAEERAAALAAELADAKEARVVAVAPPQS